MPMTTFMSSDVERSGADANVHEREWQRLVAEKRQFGSSRALRWFGREWTAKT